MSDIDSLKVGHNVRCLKKVFIYTVTGGGGQKSFGPAIFPFANAETLIINILSISFFLSHYLKIVCLWN